MEDLPYAIAGIVVFWILVVFGFIMFVCCLRRKTTNLHQNENSLPTSSSSPHPGPQRIIQIYYVENCDASITSSRSTLKPEDLLSRVLARIEDSPPSYEEASSSSAVVGNNNVAIENDRFSIVPVVQHSSSSDYLPPNNTNTNQRIDRNIENNIESVTNSLNR